MKQCSICNQLKNISEFVKNKNTYRNYCKVCHSDTNHRYWLSTRRDSLGNIFSSYKYSASKRKIDFSISYEDFALHQNIPCYYCGEKIDKIRLDRIDNNTGYTKENVISCCWKCNKNKGNMSLDDIVSLANGMVKLQFGKTLLEYLNDTKKKG